MIRIITALILLLLSHFTEAQSNYEKGMSEAFALMTENKNDESANLLERIAKAESENWIPAYHLALLQARTSFMTKDKAKREAKIAMAEDYIAAADALSPNNSEVYVIKAMINVAKIAAEPMVYGPTLSAPTEKLYQKAIELDAKNPRAHSGLAEFQMGGARFFGQDLTPYCTRLQESIAIYDAFEPKEKFYPNWGKQWTLQVIKSCGGTKETAEETTKEARKEPAKETIEASVKGASTIEATVTNVLKEGGDVIFALYDTEENFLKRTPVDAKKVAPADGKATAQFENVQEGTYAIVVLHDMNGNEQMDYQDNGMPKEDYGASNNVMRMGPPSFADAKFTVADKSVTLEIRF